MSAWWRRLDECEASTRRARCAIGARAGLVPRTRLVDELRAASDVPVVLVVGGGGFGKTTLVSQWLRDDRRSVAWLTASRQHDDPAVLLADIVRGLDEFEPLEPRAKQQLAGVAIDFSSVVVPRFERTIAERARPFVLVIDDAQRLRRRSVWALVQALADCMPAGSQLVLISRAEPDLTLGRMRADRRVHTMASASLAMDRGEAGALVRRGRSLPARSARRPSLVTAPRDGRSASTWRRSRSARKRIPPQPPLQFAGDDRLVVDYVREELLSALPRRIREFLAARLGARRARRSGLRRGARARPIPPRCSPTRRRSLQLLIPLDRRGAAYRMHQLMRDTLRAELARREPELERQLHERAATWYEAGGDHRSGGRASPACR